MFVVINGPLGVGKSSLGEALSERITGSVHLDGDRIAAVNPQPEQPLELLHTTIALLVRHFREAGYLHFVVNHFWASPADLDKLVQRLREIDPGAEIRCYLATLSLNENIARIEERQSTRAADEIEFEMRTVKEERRLLDKWTACKVGQPFDMSGSLEELVQRMLGDLRAEFGEDF